MGDFRDEDKVLRGHIEDVQVEIDRKQRTLSGFESEISTLLKQKEVLEVDIEDLYKEKQKLEQDLRRYLNEKHE